MKKKQQAVTHSLIHAGAKWNSPDLYKQSHDIIFIAQLCKGIKQDLLCPWSYAKTSAIPAHALPARPKPKSGQKAPADTRGRSRKKRQSN